MNDWKRNFKEMGIDIRKLKKCPNCKEKALLLGTDLKEISYHCHSCDKLFDMGLNEK